MNDYAARLTDLAVAKGGVELEQIVREEIAKLLEDGLPSPLMLVFHTFEVGDQEFVCYPCDGALEVDTCHQEPMRSNPDGPFPNQTMPRGVSGRAPV